MTSVYQGLFSPRQEERPWVRGWHIIRTSTFYLWVRGLDSRCGNSWHLLHEKSQLTLYRKSWVFSGYTPLTGWVGTSPTSWPFHRSCTPWSDMSHKVAVIGALRKRLTRSGWDASFLIQLCFQLQVRMISTPIQYMLGRGDKWPHVHIFTETIFEWIRSMDVLCL